MKNKIMATAMMQKTQQNTDITNDINNTNNGTETFKERKKNAKIKKAIGIILLILATLAIIGAIFFLYKAFKSRHDAIEAEKNNPKHETLKKQINAKNDEVNTLNDKLTAQRNSNEITFSENGKDYKAVFDKETNTFNVFEESQFSSKSGATLQLTSNNGKEIFFKENGKQMKYVYNEAKDCFDVFEAGKNGKFSKYPVKTIKHMSVEEINKLKNVDFPKYMKIGAPMLGGGALLGIGGGCVLASANNEQQDIEEQEQASQLNLLSQTPYVGGYTYTQPYNQLTQQAINNEMATKYNTTGINQYNAGSIQQY